MKRSACTPDTRWEMRVSSTPLKRTEELTAPTARTNEHLAGFSNNNTPCGAAQVYGCERTKQNLILYYNLLIIVEFETYLCPTLYFRDCGLQIRVLLVFKIVICMHFNTNTGEESFHKIFQVKKQKLTYDSYHYIIFIILYSY